MRYADPEVDENEGNVNEEAGAAGYQQLFETYRRSMQVVLREQPVTLVGRYTCWATREEHLKERERLLNCGCSLLTSFLGYRCDSSI